MKDRLLSLSGHLRGWRTRKKLLVFESDDWGEIRMPSAAALAAMKRTGMERHLTLLDYLDCLETHEDFDALMNVLSSHRDKHGNPAIFTLNTVMGNPDFEAIRSDGFEVYHHQHFFDAYRQAGSLDMESRWRKAMEAGLISPQLHGCEHLNVDLWMRDLKSGNKPTRQAFDHGFYALTTRTASPRQDNYLAAFWAESEQELAEAGKRLRLGLEMFEKTFQQRSSTFIPCNYVLPRELEPQLVQAGVGLLQGQRGQLLPLPKTGGTATRRSYIGQKNCSGLVCTIRNVRFEPYEDQATDWVGNALRQIDEAFRFGKPAIVTSHRVNFSGGIEIENRERSLRLLEQLLGQVCSRWPDINFTPSNRLFEEMTAA